MENKKKSENKDIIRTITSTKTFYSNDLSCIYQLKNKNNKKNEWKNEDFEWKKFFPHCKFSLIIFLKWKR